MKRFITMAFIVCLASSLQAEEPAFKTYMNELGELKFSDSFDKNTPNERWWFSPFWTVQDDALTRTSMKEEHSRIFLKDPSIQNMTILLDFKLGKDTGFRVVTGGGGYYNAVTHITPTHLEINTGVHRADNYPSSRLAECPHQLETGKWYPITIEFQGDEMVVSINDEVFMVTHHPTIDRERTYFAFQCDGDFVAVDNVRMYESKAKNNWNETKKKLLQLQDSRPAVKREPWDRFQYLETKYHAEDYLYDEKYRGIVDHHEKLQADMKEKYPIVYKTHKELFKANSAKQKKLRETNEEFKELHHAVNKGKTAERIYLESKIEGIKEKPAHIYRVQMEKLRVEALASDKEFQALIAKREELQKKLENTFPDAFIDVDATKAKQNDIRKELLAKDPEFKKGVDDIAAAHRAKKDYQRKKHDDLVKAEEIAMAEKNKEKDKQKVKPSKKSKS